MKILVTGGPVHAYLDKVKIITNKFHGGRMAQLADQLNHFHTVTYLTAKGSKLPKASLKVVYHDGYDDYKQKVVELSQTHDAAVLGAAIANLIPARPWKDKFPSHEYKEGDVINIPFVVAPRVINLVKKANPNIQLFGFKLLSNVPQETLISAAYDIVLDAKATAVFANLEEDLDHKWIVTKERSIIHTTDPASFILDRLQDEYYHTTVMPQYGHLHNWMPKYVDKAKKLLALFPHQFPTQQGGMVFGTVAVRMTELSNTFLTTARGKKELQDWTVVSVDHEQKMVYACPKKATLNAPLLDHIFKTNPKVNSIIHFHYSGEDYKFKVLPWFPPGTVRDSLRDVTGSFVVEHHGTFVLLEQ